VTTLDLAFEHSRYMAFIIPLAVALELFPGMPGVIGMLARRNGLRA
jgi:hypothetical protein